MTERAIVAIAVIGLLVLVATGGKWGPVVDSVECAIPKTSKVVRL